MSITKKLSVLAVVVFALSALGVANASAATKFTASSAPGTLKGSGGVQKFVTAAGTVECKKDSATGAIAAKETTEQEATVKYEECNAFGFTVHVSSATYLFTIDGTVHVQSSIVLTVTGSIFGECTITVTPQTLSGITYTNATGGKIDVTANVTGIDYDVHNVSGSLCGTEGTHTDGTYTGTTLVEEEGGTVSVD